jgi:hypothetical protein
MGREWANTPAQTSGVVVIRNDLQRNHVGGIIMTNNGCLHATNNINGAGGVSRGNSGGRWTIPRHRDVTRDGQPDAQSRQGGSKRFDGACRVLPPHVVPC